MCNQNRMSRRDPARLKDLGCFGDQIRYAKAAMHMQMLFPVFAAMDATS